MLMNFTDEQLKKEKQNIIILIILTVIWFGFFLHNSITVNKQYVQMEQISQTIATNSQQILKTQELILEKELLLIELQK